jgi:hypothetical protein
MGTSLVVLLAAVPLHADDLSDAAALEKAGKLQEAAAAYAKSEKPAAVAATVRVLLRLGRPADAEKAAAAALAKSPEDAVLLVARAEARLGSCEAATAQKADASATMDRAYEGQEWVDKALKKDAKSVAARVLSARYIGFITGDSSDAARKLLETVVAEDPKAAEAWFELGRYFARKAGNKKDDDLWGRAEKAFLAAADADPSRGDAWINAGRAKGWLGRGKPEVAECFEKAALAMPNDMTPLTLLAKWSASPQASVEAHKRLDTARPNDRCIRLSLALAHDKTGKTGEGTAIFDKAISASPADPVLPLDKGSFLLQANLAEPAVAAYVRAIETAGPGPNREVYDTIDLVATRTKGLSAEQRRALWDALTKKWPKELQAPNNAAVWFRDVALDFPASAAWYERALAAAPEDVMLLNDAGLVYWAPGYLNDAAKGEPYFRRAIAAAKKQGVAKPDANVGYRDAVDNLVKLLRAGKRAADLRALADEIQGDPRCEGIRQVAASVDGAK